MHKLRLLFVCIGNICRSPMAAALAAKLFGERVSVESAGISPVYDEATPEAVRVMSEVGLDISSHRTRSVSEVELDRFDTIVALTPSVRAGLPPTCRPERIVTWEIEDPYGGDLEVYRECARAIETELRKMEPRLSSSQG
jgi:protein-tyrosine-phosphatase